MTITWTERMLTLPDGQQIHAMHGIHPQGADKPTLVFLHEALGHIRMWKRFPEQLAEKLGCNVFVNERLGYGESSPITLPRADDYLVPEGEQRLGETLDAAGIEKAILIGHSDGGTVALIGAATLKGRVVALITEAAHVYADHLTLQGIREAVELYNTTNLPERLARYHGERTELLFRAWSETWLRESCHKHMDFRPWLKDIECPALIIQGEQDQYGVPEQVTDICAGIGSHAQPCFISDCGHVPHLEATDAVLDVMAVFISKQLAR
ncbi:MAG: alpha/beta hydrolase [Neptuniibacter caesariensis]|uniref:Alpha/beta hydrolase n=1 Tax=Neptuniibacter caesariensis TaxID=207954 RepID=A0A2G6JB28_NEPCE|nr:MAG: alpha/beta hydrolase [Neptuniibacter caesariensis]